MRAFTTTGYTALVRAFLDAGYETVGLESLSPEPGRLFLRHDIDFCPAYALPIAEAEAALGCAGTYYVLATSPFYNLLDPEVRAALRRLTELGHAIGLHFDVGAYPGSPELEVLAGQERQLLERMAEAPVRSISFHRPAPELVGMVGDFAGLPHTYQPRFVEEIAYYSDSQGSWRFGHPLDSDAFANRSAMQLLTHPVWWRFETEEAPTPRLNRWLAEDLARRTEDVARNCKSYDPSAAPATGAQGLRP